MKSLVGMILLCCVSGCANAVSSNAICDGTKVARTEHAAALADDGGPSSLVTGAQLIRLLDAGCTER
jgi:hypothetical protein